MHFLCFLLISCHFVLIYEVANNVKNKRCSSSGKNWRCSCEISTSSNFFLLMTTFNFLKGASLSNVLKLLMYHNRSFPCLNLCILNIFNPWSKIQLIWQLIFIGRIQISKPFSVFKFSFTFLYQLWSQKLSHVNTFTCHAFNGFLAGFPTFLKISTPLATPTPSAWWVLICAIGLYFCRVNSHHELFLSNAVKIY